MQNRPGLTIALVVLAIVGSILGLATFQNHTRTTQLSFDLGFQAWQLQDPISVPLLMWICFLVGFVISAMWFGGSAMRANSKAKRLEQQIALGSGGGSSSNDGWR